MDVDKYEELTGLTVSDADETRYEAVCRRTKKMLEEMLGFTFCPAESGTRKFTYNKHDKNLPIDPCTVINEVKLVRNDEDIETFTTDDHMLVSNRDYIKYITMLYEFDEEDVTLQVDADWLWEFEDDIPEDLLDVWAEMVTYYADQKRDIKSESLGTHSYTRSEKAAPEQDEKYLRIIRKYAGPNGSAYPRHVL